MPIGKSAYSAKQFSLFRILLGIYLMFFFLNLIPYGGDLFSRVGIFQETPFSSPFPHIFEYLDQPLATQGFLFGMGIFSLSFALGYYRKIMAVILWYGTTSLLNRIPFLSIPNEGFVGWLLIATTLIPCGEPYSLQKRIKKEWRAPEHLSTAAWIVFSLAYTMSGLAKFQSPSWLDGSALKKILLGPIARPILLIPFLISLPDSLLKILTWISLGIETLYFPLFLFKKTRAIGWTLITIFHLIIGITLSLTEVTLSMLITQIFLFDPLWFCKKSGKDPL